MVLVAPRSAKLVEARGARFTLLLGYVFCFLGFLTMLLLWKEDSSVLAGRARLRVHRHRRRLRRHAASHSLTGSVPVQRAGMASGTADLQRDLGGAIMQSIFGALLTAGYATAVAAAIAASPNSAAGHRQRPDRADEVVLERRGRRAAVPAVREPDHRRREDVVPRRRPVGLHRRHRRGPARRGARVLPVPEARTRRSGCSRVPRRGHAARASRALRRRARPPPPATRRGSAPDRREHARRQPAAAPGVRHDARPRARRAQRPRPAGRGAPSRSPAPPGLTRSSSSRDAHAMRRRRGACAGRRRGSSPPASAGGRAPRRSRVVGCASAGPVRLTRATRLCADDRRARVGDAQLGAGRAAAGRRRAGPPGR